MIVNIIRKSSADTAPINNLNEIASDSGFNSLEYFHTTFKRFYGITPAKYRALTPIQLSNSWRTKATPDFSQQLEY